MSKIEIITRDTVANYDIRIYERETKKTKTISLKTNYDHETLRTKIKGILVEL